MKTLAVLVVMWSHNGSTQSLTIEMPTIAGCNAEVLRIMKVRPPGEGWMFCVERK